MVKDYSIEDIFDKNLVFVIPFHIFAYEKKLKTIENNEVALLRLKEHYQKIISRLDHLAGIGMLSSYEKRIILTMSKKVIDAAAANYENIRRGVGEMMGGKILEYEAKTIHNQGLAEGLTEGRITAILELLASGDITEERAAEKLECRTEELPELMAKYKIEQ